MSVADTYLSNSPYSGTKDGKDKYTDVKIFQKTEALPYQMIQQMKPYLNLLQAVGLIKLDVDSTKLATVANIKENKKNLKFLNWMLLSSFSYFCRCSGCQQYSFIEAGIIYKSAHLQKKTWNSKLWYNLICR